MIAPHVYFLLQSFVVVSYCASSFPICTGYPFYCSAYLTLTGLQEHTTLYEVCLRIECCMLGGCEIGNSIQVVASQ